MFEYFNYGAAFVILFLMLLNFIAAKESFSGLGIFYGLIFAMLFYDAYSSYSDAKSNMRYFKDGNTLICSSGGGIHTKPNMYSVSKSEGWQLSNHYFIKDSLMITVDGCEHQKKE